MSDLTPLTPHRAPEAGHPTPGRGPAEAEPPREPLHLWEGYGVEIEMMIVDRESLDVRPVADRLMESITGVSGASEVERGPVAWSNELALHVLELKTAGPAETLRGLHRAFHQNVREANRHLEAMGCRLLPGGMHPWMDPGTELRLWPHEYTDVYRAFDRIFGCRGHGWANLQSTHVNLPFDGDAEFYRLHEAIRLVLPLLPALAGSSPFQDGRPGPALDNRLLAYRDNARRIPSVTGRVVPERVRTARSYREDILEAIYADLEPLDPGGTLRDEWVNARGAIARFSRGSVEIRVLDAQECPRADVAVVGAVVGAVRLLADGPLRADEAPDVDEDGLVDILERTTLRGSEARITDRPYLELLGLEGTAAARAQEVWWHLLERTGIGQASDDPRTAPLRTILEEGNLAVRLRKAAGLRALPSPDDATPSRDVLRATYERMAECLEENELFRP